DDNTWIKPSTKEVFPREVEFLLKLMNTDGIVKMIDYYLEGSNAYIIMDKIANGQSLKDYLTDMGSFDDPTGRLVIWNILKAVMNLWAQSIIHRDLKSANVVIDRVSKKTYLIDFGSAKFFDEHPYATNHMITSGIISPECRVNSKQKSNK